MTVNMSNLLVNVNYSNFSSFRRNNYTDPENVEMEQQVSSSSSHFDDPFVLNAYCCIIALFWIQTGWKCYLNFRQIRLCLSTRDKSPPPQLNLEKEDFDSARGEELEDLEEQIWLDLYFTTVCTIILHTSTFYRVWMATGPILNWLRTPEFVWSLEDGKIACFCVIFLIVYPILFWDEDHLFWPENLQLTDLQLFFCSFSVIAVILALILVSLIIGIIEFYGFLFHLYLCHLFWAIFVVHRVFLAALISWFPCLRNEKTLEDGPLKRRLEAVCSHFKFPGNRLCFSDFDGSLRWSACDSVVFSEDLLDGYYYSKEEGKTTMEESKHTEKQFSYREIESVLACQLGRWKLNEFAKLCVVLLFCINYLGLIFVAFYQNSTMYQIFGFPLKNRDSKNSTLFKIMSLDYYEKSKPLITNKIKIKINSEWEKETEFDMICKILPFSAPTDPKEKPVLLGILFVLFIFKGTFYFLIVELPIVIIRRRVEYAKIEFAVRLGYGKAMKSYILKIYKENIYFPLNDPLYSFWYNDYLSILEKLDYIDMVMIKYKKITI